MKLRDEREAHLWEKTVYRYVEHGLPMANAIQHADAYIVGRRERYATSSGDSGDTTAAKRERSFHVAYAWDKGNGSAEMTICGENPRVTGAIIREWVEWITADVRRRGFEQGPSNVVILAYHELE